MSSLFPSPSPPSNQNGRSAGRTRRLLLAILAVAVALRVAFILIYLEPGRIYFGDTVRYSTAAESILAGKGLGADYARQPLYAVFLAGILALFPGKLVAAQLADAVLACLVVLLTYQVGKRIWSEREGLIGAALVALHPFLVALSGFLYAEVLFTLLLFLCVRILLDAESRRQAFLAGAVGGAAVLTKASGLAALLAGAIWLLLFAPLSRRTGRALCFMAGGALVVAPWVVRNYALFRDLSLVEARKEIHVYYAPDEPLPFRIEIQHRRMVRGAGGPGLQQRGRRALSPAHVIEQLGAFWSLWPDRLKTARRDVRLRSAAKDARVVVENHPIDKTARYRLPLAIVLAPYYVLAVAGLWLSRDRFRESSLLLLVILAFAFGRALFVAKLRYRLPIEPAVALFAAAGLAWVAAWVLPRLRRG